uniref:Uncharacterized protein n=1 Tax=Rhizophora mucronata TaxID=61149 RepID=A0A2P2R338_RHIMU
MEHNEMHLVKFCFLKIMSFVVGSSVWYCYL